MLRLAAQRCAEGWACRQTAFALSARGPCGPDAAAAGSSLISASSAAPGYEWSLASGGGPMFIGGGGVCTTGGWA